MVQRIEISLKNKILKSVKEDWIWVHQIAEEYWINHKTIYNWLKKESELNGWNSSNLWEIKRLKKDKEDLLIIIWELTAELNKSKKNK